MEEFNQKKKKNEQNKITLQMKRYRKPWKEKTTTEWKKKSAEKNHFHRLCLISCFTSQWKTKPKNKWCEINIWQFDYTDDSWIIIGWIKIWNAFWLWFLSLIIPIAGISGISIQVLWTEFSWFSGRADNNILWRKLLRS